MLKIHLVILKGNFFELAVNDSLGRESGGGLLDLSSLQGG